MSGHVLDLLSAYLDGELSPPERGMVEAHLAACEDCAARLEDFAAIDGAARDLPVEAPADYFDTFADRLRPRLRGRVAPARRVPAWTWAAAAALLLAVLTPLTLERRPELEPRTPAASTRLDPGVADPQKPLSSQELKRDDRPSAAPLPRARRVPAPTQAPVEARDPAGPAEGVESDAFAEPPPPPPLAASAPAPAAPAAALEESFQPEAARAQKAARAEEQRGREREALSRDADSARGTGEVSPVGTGLRGGAAGDVPGRREADAGDEFALLRARSQAGAGERMQALRDLRDAWRSFAARNPSGARGDEARWQVIEIGFRAWRAGGEAGDRAVLLRDARTYLERGDGAHAERVRALLAEAGGAP